MVAAGFVLFMPDDAARPMGISEIREDYKAMWWIGVVLAAAIWSREAFRYITEKSLFLVRASRTGDYQEPGSPSSARTN